MKFQQLPVFCIALLLIINVHGGVDQIIATNATKLKESELTFFAAHKDYLQITMTDGFGYSEHLVAGEIKTAGKFERRAFFQTYKYDATSNRIFTIRQIIKPVHGWEFLKRLMDEENVQNLSNSFSTEKEIALDAGTLFIKIRSNQNTVSLSKFSPDFGGALWLWVESIENEFGVNFSN